MNWLFIVTHIFAHIMELVHSFPSTFPMSKTRPTTLSQSVDNKIWGGSLA